jgi:hypothetical protein
MAARPSALHPPLVKLNPFSRAARGNPPRRPCLACGAEVLLTEPHLRLHGAFVHARCSGYRSSSREAGSRPS